MITTTSTKAQAALIIIFVLIASALVANGERGDQHLRSENHAASSTPTTSANRAGRPPLQRSSGQRNLLTESRPVIDTRTGRPKLLRTKGQRHLMLARDSNHESTTTRRLQDQGVDDEKSTFDSVKDTYDEVMAIDETPPQEWTSTQKWGVAIGVLAAFVIVSCIWRCLCCK